jgi:hypothetical protein
MQVQILEVFSGFVIAYNMYIDQIIILQAYIYLCLISQI